MGRGGALKGQGSVRKGGARQGMAGRVKGTTKGRWCALAHRDEMDGLRKPWSAVCNCIRGINKFDFDNGEGLMHQQA